MRFSLHLRAVIGAVLIAGTFSAANASKLYKWVDKNGNVHYSDSVPPEALDKKREEMSESGLVVNTVDRAPTPEEKALLDKKKAEDAALAVVEAERDRQEELMMAAYTSEKDVLRARDQKIEMINRQIESYEASMKSLQGSLTQLTARAAESQRAGRPVSEALTAQIAESKKSVQQQEAAIKAKRIERGEVAGDYEAELKRYREMVARMNARG